MVRKRVSHLEKCFKLSPDLTKMYGYALNQYLERKSRTDLILSVHLLLRTVCDENFCRIQCLNMMQCRLGYEQ